MPKKKVDPRKALARTFLTRLAKLYPTAHCALHHHNAFQLLIATILSAQCTDKLVNTVTPSLFKRFPDARSFANADNTEVEAAIKSTGFYRNKAKNIIACSKKLIENHQSEVPATLEDLVVLPGAGRKTANVVLGDAFGIPGIVVDTHVHRLSRRMGLTRCDTPETIEQDLMKIIPKKSWTVFGHRIIWHGRAICDAKKPKCSQCTLNKLCPKIGVDPHKMV